MSTASTGCYNRVRVCLLNATDEILQYSSGLEMAVVDTGITCNLYHKNWTFFCLYI